MQFLSPEVTFRYLPTSPVPTSKANRPVKSPVVVVPPVHDLGVAHYLWQAEIPRLRFTTSSGHVRLFS